MAATALPLQGHRGREAGHCLRDVVQCRSGDCRSAIPIVVLACDGECQQTDEVRFSAG